MKQNNQKQKNQKLPNNLVDIKSIENLLLCLNISEHDFEQILGYKLGTIDSWRNGTPIDSLSQNLLFLLQSHPQLFISINPFDNSFANHKFLHSFEDVKTYISNINSHISVWQVTFREQQNHHAKKELLNETVQRIHDYEKYRNQQIILFLLEKYDISLNEATIVCQKSFQDERMNGAEKIVEKMKYLCTFLEEIHRENMDRKL